jgi:hypothetical protein
MSDSPNTTANQGRDLFRNPYRYKKWWQSLGDLDISIFGAAVCLSNHSPLCSS